MPRIERISKNIRKRVGSVSFGGNISIGYYDEVASEGQTQVSLPFAYEASKNQLIVFVNGIHRRPGENNDYQEAGPQMITFNFPLSAGDNITVYHLSAQSVSE